MKPARKPLPNAWSFLGIAVLAAWFPICRPYLRVADDFHFADWLQSKGVPIYFHEDGVWRILGHELIHGAALAHPLLPGILALATHGIAATLLMLALRRMLSSESLALLLALIFAVYPWADEALMWASAYTYVLATTFFLAGLCLLLRVFPLKNAWAVPLCILCTVLSLLSHEALFFAQLVAGALPLVRERDAPLRERLTLAGAPVAGCGIWMILYRTFPGRMPAEHVVLNPRTILSGIFYQYTNLDIFEPWLRAGTRDLLFFAWSPWQFAAGALLITAVALYGRRALAGLRAETGREASAGNLMLGYLVALLLATVAIYAVGGGFSLDSRKKYAIIPVLLMGVGCGIERIAPKVRVKSWVILAVVLSGILTTWLQIALWRYEATRLDLLIGFLRTQRDPAAVRVVWDSRIQEAWPRSTRHWGMPVEKWVLANAIRLDARLLPPALPHPQAAAVRFDAARFTWVPME